MTDDVAATAAEPAKFGADSKTCLIDLNAKAAAAEETRPLRPDRRMAKLPSRITKTPPPPISTTTTTEFSPPPFLSLFVEAADDDLESPSSPDDRELDLAIAEDRSDVDEPKDGGQRCFFWSECRSLAESGEDGGSWSYCTACYLGRRQLCSAPRCTRSCTLQTEGGQFHPYCGMCRRLRTHF
jgi:hypothetical protein